MRYLVYITGVMLTAYGIFTENRNMRIDGGIMQLGAVIGSVIMFFWQKNDEYEERNNRK